LLLAAGKGDAAFQKRGHLKGKIGAGT
jgi:hypothetical protein